MKRNDTFKGRFYEVENGRSYPSVTTILTAIGKPALVPWAAKVERELVLDCSADLYEDIHGTPKMSRIAFITTMQQRLGKARAHQKLLAKAGDLGSQAHALIEWTLRAKMCQEAGPSPMVSDKAQWAFMAWEDWAKSVNLKPILIEQTVWSDTHGYAGTLDLLAEIEGKLTVIDWKTGKSIYPEAHLQSAAYRTAIREMGHADPVQGIIVRLPKVETDPNFEAVPAGKMPDGRIMPETELLEVFLGIKRTWTYSQLMDTWKPKEEVKEVVTA